MTAVLDPQLVGNVRQNLTDFLGGLADRLPGAGGTDPDREQRGVGGEVVDQLPLSAVDWKTNWSAPVPPVR